jgi:TolA-binding protein
MAEKIRYTRRDLKGPDEFISTFGRIVAWCKENSKAVATAVSVVLAALVVALATSAYFRWQESRAGAEIWPFLDQAREMLAAPGGAVPGGMAEMEKSIASLAEKHSGTRAALFAQYYLGCIAFRRGDYEAGAARFRDAIKTGKDEGALRFLLRNGLASSLEAKGDYLGAAASYREAAESAGPGLKAQARLDEGRALELAGKKAEAAAVYRKIGEETPDTLQKDLIDIKTAHME